MAANNINCTLLVIFPLSSTITVDHSYWKITLHLLRRCQPQSSLTNGWQSCFLRMYLHCHYITNTFQIHKWFNVCVKLPMLNRVHGHTWLLGIFLTYCRLLHCCLQPPYKISCKYHYPRRNYNNFCKLKMAAVRHVGFKKKYWLTKISP